MIGTSWLGSADTNNLIFCIDCTMPADTNNPRVERGVTCRCETLTHGENQLRHQAALFPVATLALLTPPSTLTSCCHRLPRCHVIASLNIDVVLSPPPSMQPPSTRSCRLPQRRCRTVAASLDAAPSPPSTPMLHCRCLPRFRVVASLNVECWLSRLYFVMCNQLVLFWMWLHYLLD
jgi:hypothetical protein